MAVRVLLACTAALSGGAFVGCAGAPATPADGGAGARAEAMLLSATYSGLAVRRWRVDDEPDRISSVLMRYADESSTEATHEAMARNGLRLVRVPVDDLDAIRGALGGATLDVEGWLGQVYNWMSVRETRIGPEAQAIAIDGYVRRLRGGSVRLMLRAWTIPMEDGPYLYIELRPEHDRSRTSRLSQVLGRSKFRGERFQSMALELLMEAGYAYVLTSAAPGETWEFVPEDDTTVDADESSDAGDADGNRAPGPATETPPTLGELLLRAEAAPGQREILLFVPRLPSTLFPPALPEPPESDPESELATDRARRVRAGS